MENRQMPQYGDRYYARIKAFERQFVKEYDDPHSAMLTFSGSSENANGGWRCPADHLWDVIESWRPKRGRGVYHVLRDVLEDKPWEYVIVVEKHRSGYGHVHCGVFIDGKIAEEDFHRVIDTHLRKCDIAGWDAHNYHSPDPSDRPISVNRIDPGNVEDGSIGNLGSYLGEYIGAYGEELFKRGLDELMLRGGGVGQGLADRPVLEGGERDHKARPQGPPRGRRPGGSPGARGSEPGVRFRDTRKRQFGCSALHRREPELVNRRNRTGGRGL